MPWTPAQHRLFEAAAHNPAIAKAHGIPQPKAAKMADEGIKRPPGRPRGPGKAPPMAAAEGPRKPKPSPQALAAALMKEPV